MKSVPKSLVTKSAGEAMKFESSAVPALAPGA